VRRISGAKGDTGRVKSKVDKLLKYPSMDFQDCLKNQKVIRDSCLCPVCLTPKAKGLLVCWPCWREFKRAHEKKKKEAVLPIQFKLNF